MTDKIDKNLAKFSKSELAVVEDILKKIITKFGITLWNVSPL